MGPQSDRTESLQEGEETPEISLSPFAHRRQAMWGHWEEAAVCKPGRASVDPIPDDTLILNCRPPEL